MIIVLALVAALHVHDAAPSTLVVSTPRGESRLTVRMDPLAGPGIPAKGLALALNATYRSGQSDWVDLMVARQPFRFLLGAPVYQFNERMEPLAGWAWTSNDTLFLPLQFAVEVLPKLFAERYRYDAANGKLIESGARTTPLAATPPPVKASPGPVPGPAGLRFAHLVTVDPGHGGIDPGNPGIFFPRGITESDVTLQIGILLREELKRRGVDVRMTRTTDTLIALADRGSYCTETCDLFVSLHVNSLKKRPGYSATRGYETYFLAEAKTEEAERVERMENEAVRYEAPRADAGARGGLDFILRDLQLNEYLRESARMAELVQSHLENVHTGDNRGVKQAGFMVLTRARRPAVLVEMGYSTNPQDGALLTRVQSQRELAAAIADAVVQYLQEYERRVSLPADSDARR
ncbi:MAG: N-acetylmuramoyl-L-alanine amidase [Gemmatimonadota bacterium]